MALNKKFRHTDDLWQTGREIAQITAEQKLTCGEAFRFVSSNWSQSKNLLVDTFDVLTIVRESELIRLANESDDSQDNYYWEIETRKKI